MDILLPELLDKIRDDMFRITDVRNLSRVNKKYNKLCKKRIFELELLYQTKYEGLFLKKYLMIMIPTIEKYTVEIILDGCYNLLTEKYYGNNPVICNMFAFVGNLGLLKYAHSKLCPIDATLFNCAAYIGHIDMLNWIINNTDLIPTTNSLVINVAIGGHVNVLDWMEKHNMVICPKIICNHLGKSGHLCVLQWLLSHNYMISNSMFGTAAKNGHLHIINWAHENDYISESSFYLNLHDCDSLCGAATQNGHTHILDWALKHKYIIEVNKYEYRCIIKNNHLNVLQWLHKNNFTLDCKIYSYIIKYDKVHILQWLYENGYKIQDYIYKTKLDYKKNILNWIIKNITFIKPINMTYCDDNNKGVNLVIIYNKSNENKKKYIDTLKLDFDSIEILLEKYVINKKQYHFIINEEKFTIKKYGNKDNCDGQQIIYLENDGSIHTCGFNCGNKCWWYFLISSKNIRVDLKKLVVDKINNCSQHNKYIKYID